ncbi:MAG: hypothetical protein ACK4NF_00190 [Planctomycetota bacterium]
MNYPFLNVDFDNKRYKLLVDTGATNTLIFRFKNSLQNIQYAKRKWARYKTFLLPSFLKKVTFQFKNIKCSASILIVDWHKYLVFAKSIIKNIQIYSYFQNTEYDGVLGLDLIRKVILKINPKNNIAKLTNNLNCSKFYTLPLHLISNHIAVEMKINNKIKYALLDTGINVADIVVKRKYKKCKLINKQQVLLWNNKKLINIYDFEGNIHFLNENFKTLKLVVLKLTKTNNPIICYPFLKRFNNIILEKGKRLHIQS